MSDNEEQLNDFFKEEDLTLIVDMSNMAYRALYAIIYTTPQDNGKFELWKHTFLNSIFSVISKINPTKVIFACDGQNNWRYDIYKEYKSKRKLDKQKSDIQFDKFYVVFDELLNDMKLAFTNIVLIKEDRTEADDVIAVLSRTIEGNIIIVSSDNDMWQLLSPKVRQFKPITETFVECINPTKELKMKILTGDKGDSVPPLRPRLGIKTAVKIMEEGLDKFLATNPILQSNYNRNKKLIDLTEIPEDIKIKIINTFATYKITPIDMMFLFKFFNKHRLQKLLSQWNIIGDSIKGLYNYGTMEERKISNSESK